VGSVPTFLPGFPLFVATAALTDLRDQHSNETYESCALARQESGRQ
jgi:hypothetical protein